MHVTWGQSVHLPCRFNGFIQESQDLQQLLAAQQRQQQAHQQQQQMLTGAGTFYGAGHHQSAPGALQEFGHSYAHQGQAHGLAQPANYIQWYYHRRDNVLSPGYPVLQRRDKFILAADQGLVIMNANEPGWYQCRLGSQIIYSYNLIIDTSEYLSSGWRLFALHCFVCSCIRLSSAGVPSAQEPAAGVSGLCCGSCDM